jgi:hypothetical protein
MNVAIEARNISCVNSNKERVYHFVICSTSRINFQMKNILTFCPESISVHLLYFKSIYKNEDFDQFFLIYLLSLITEYN